jgi:predicted amidohydrolase
MQNTPRSAPAEEKDAGAELLPEPGPITRFLSRKAKQHNAYIIGSYWRKNPDGPGRFNSAILFDRRGNVVGWYDKMYPTIREMEGGVLPGRRAVVFDTDFGRIGAMICFDLNFPELAAEYKKQGVELICFLSVFRGGKLTFDLALNNRCFVASAIWKEGGEIVDPLGHMLVESNRNAPVIFQRINLDSRIIHVDYNRERVREMKKKYGPLVKIESASREALFRISSLHPDKSIDELMREFEIEDYDAYLDRSRREREKALHSD